MKVRDFFLLKITRGTSLVVRCLGSIPSQGIRSWVSEWVSECVCVCVCVLVTQSRPTLCDLTDCRPSGFSSMKCSRQEYWSGLPFPPPEDLPNPGIQSLFPALQTDTLPSELSNPGGLGSIPGQGTRSYMLHLKILHGQINKYFFKMMKITFFLLSTSKDYYSLLLHL